MKLATLTVDAINQLVADNQDSSHRWHLGASLLGRECARELWYTYRWIKKIYHDGRLLRLFDRGDREESVFIEYLRSLGCQVWDIDPDTGKQFTISSVEGHLGGSLDGVAIGIPDVPEEDEAALTEFKTFAEKYFKKLVKEGLRATKPEHYVQMQLYMNQYGLKYGVYFAVNKNNDELHIEVIELDKRVASQYLERGKMIIMTHEPPPKVHNDPSWWKCKQCDYHSVCHGDDMPDKNCRTCRHSKPGDKAKWICTLTGEIFSKPKPNEDGVKPISPMEFGCGDHHYLPCFED